MKTLNAPLIPFSSLIQALCTPAGLDCHMASSPFPCAVACEGLYADVAFFSQSVNQKDEDKFALLKEEYSKYRDRWAQSIQFSPGAGAKKNYSKFIFLNDKC